MSSAEIISIAALTVAVVGGGSSAYAVVISRRALRLEEQRDRDRAESKISISFGHGIRTKPRYVIDLNRPEPDKFYYEVTINIINGGETPEFLKTLWVEPVSGGKGVDYSPQSDVELKPRSRWPFSIDAAEIPDSDDGFVAIVHLASGQEIRSPVEHLIEGMLDDTDD